MTDPVRYLLEATKQPDLQTAVSYISEGLFLSPEVDRSTLLRCLCEIAEMDNRHSQKAITRIARDVARSDLNTAEVLLQPELVTPPSTYRAALDTLVKRSPSASLAQGITYQIALAAQRENPHVISALAAIAGLSWRELTQRAGITSPSQPTGVWKPEAMKKAMAVIDAIVCDRVPSDFPNGFAARPIELLADPDVSEKGRAGWAVVEEMQSLGVPYEVLLAQRVEGGAWRTHRDRTGGKHAHALADALCSLLDAAGHSYRRTTKSGGTMKPRQVDKLLGGGGDQVAVVLLDAHSMPAMAITISIANDGGSVAKSVARTASLAEKLSIPISAIVAGLGWAERNETAALAVAVNGRLYSDRNLDRLVESIEDRELKRSGES